MWAKAGGEGSDKTLKQKFIIRGALPGLNEYITAERTNRYKGAELKKAGGKYCASLIAWTWQMAGRRTGVHDISLVLRRPKERQGQYFVLWQKSDTGRACPI